MISYRRATLSDASACAAVEKQQPFAAGWGRNGFETELVQNYSIVWCACLKEKVVGFIALRAVADVAEILNLAVAPSYARQGIGHQLLHQALEDLKSNHITRVTLEVAQKNKIAQKLYQKEGLMVFGTRMDFYGPGAHALLMGKDL